MGGTVLWLLCASVLAAEPPTTGTPDRSPSLVLLTLDTTRADHLGSYGRSEARTPALDALAARGTRYARAVTPSPLTLPAHASLLTGLDPPEHGVRDNGTAALAADVPTLATVLRSRGYATAAFVASRVLDRRFGLARGFEVYDDRMAAERVGEYGYPERDAEAVTAAAVAWLAERNPERPYFLWIHYYDPHAPYQPPAALRGAGQPYDGEIAWMDRAIGRLLAALPGPTDGRIVAAVGDHGEALGEHGERTHGLFLYRAALEVPLILAGPGVPAGNVVAGTVGTRRLPATLLELLGGSSPLPGPALPGLQEEAEPETEPQAGAVYSETLLPASAYGWSSLQAVSDQRWRLVVAPRPELYDFVADPGETQNRIAEERAAARRLKRVLERFKAAFAESGRSAEAVSADPELAASLEKLGYLSGRSSREGEIDPKDGVALLAELDAAKALVRAGKSAEAVPKLRSLVERSPGNVPLHTHLAGALLGSGKTDEAIATYRRAVELNPGLDFLHLQLANALDALGRVDEAAAEYRLVLELNPRFAAAWLALAERAHRAGDAGEERRLLRRAAAAGTASASLLLRLGQVEMAAGNVGDAAERLRQATELLPSWPLGWLVRGQLALQRGAAVEARQALEQAVRLAPDSREGRQARQLLGNFSPPP